MVLFSRHSKNNFLEIMDYGYPQNLTADALKGFVTQKNALKEKVGHRILRSNIFSHRLNKMPTKLLLKLQEPVLGEVLISFIREMNFLSIALNL